MKFNIESMTSYNSIHPTYQHTEQFENNIESYRDGTQWFGILLAFISGAFFTISSGFVKAVKNVDPMVLLGIRAILQIITTIFIAIRYGKNLLGPKGSRLLLNFQIHETESYDMMGYICAIAATFFTALNIVIMRKCSEIHYSVVVLNISMWILVSSILFFFFVSEAHQHIKAFPNDWMTWGLILLVAATGLCGQILVTKALKIEGAGKVSVTRSLDIILAYVIQVYFFGDIPNSTSIIGAVLILGAVITIGFEREIYGICDYIP